MSDVLEILKRGDNSLEALLRAVLLDSDNKVPAERLRIVGALSDGAIIERGNNSNGDWVRFADGTQICQGDRAYSGLDTSQLFNTVPVTLSAAFANTNYFVYGLATGYPGHPGVFITGSSVSAGTLNINFYCFSVPPSVTTLNFRFFAIGKWK